MREGRGLRRWHLLALAAVLASAAGLRFHRIDAQSLWQDELITLSESAGHYWDDELVGRKNTWIRPGPRPTSMDEARSLGRTVGLLRNQLHPPLYYLLLRGWRSAFGDSAAVARALSAVFSLVAVGLLFRAGALLRDAETGLWAALLMALAAPQIVYAQEVRSYALLLMAGCAALVGVASILRHGASRPRVALLALSCLAMALTHYLAAGAIVAVVAYAALVLRGAERRAALVGLAVAGALFWILWGHVALAQTDRLPMADFLRTGGEGHTIRTLAATAAVPLRNLVPLGSGFLSGGVLPADAALGAVLFLVPPFLFRGRRHLELPWLWLVGTAGFLTVLDLARSSSTLVYVRYTLLAAPAVCLLIPGMVAGTRIRRTLMPIVVAAVGLATFHSGLYNRSWKEDHRGFAGWIGESVPPPGRLVFQTVPPGEAGEDGEREWHARLRYAALSHYAFSPARAVAFVDRPASGEVLEPLLEEGRFWMVTPPHAAPDTSLVPPVEVVREAHFASVASVYELVTVPAAAAR